MAQHSKYSPIGLRAYERTRSPAWNASLRDQDSIRLENFQPYSTPSQNRSTERLRDKDKFSPCKSRQDTTGIWNKINNSNLFILHIFGCVMFVVWMTKWVDGQNFRPGTPASIFGLGRPLFQTQINGLLSLALVLLRVVATCCTAPLVWTIILVLLETRGLTLREISRLNNYRVPVVFRPKSKECLAWLLWVMMVMLFLWPSNFAAPVASSSLAWNPLARDLGSPIPIKLPISPGVGGDFWMLRAPEWQMNSLMTSVLWTGTSPGYAFTSTDVALRRYFDAPETGALTHNSTMDLILPYFDVDIQWINPHDYNRTRNLTWTEHSDYVGSRRNGPSRVSGAVIVMKDEEWDPITSIPKKAEKFVLQRLFGVKISTYYGEGDPDRMLCQHKSPVFWSLPAAPLATAVYQVEKSWSVDCYQAGIATIRAGVVHGKDCKVDLIGSHHASATCNTTQDFAKVEPDWVAPVAMNMLSEVLKHTVMLNFTGPWLDGTLFIEQYTRSALTLGYHAAWSSAVRLLQTSETSTYKPGIPMVRASVDRGKLLVWLSMQLTMTIAAALVWVALKFTTAKFVRNTTLVPLRLDFSEVTHHELSDGLCDAIALSDKDYKLPRVTFSKEDEDTGSPSTRCRRRVVFANTNSLGLRQSGPTRSMG